MICPICEIENGENPQYCSNCGWEFVANIEAFLKDKRSQK